MSNNDEEMPRPDLDCAGSLVRDLVDFYRRWPEFRGEAVELAEGVGISAKTREILCCMVALIDRIGDHDIRFDRDKPQ